MAESEIRKLYRLVVNVAGPGFSDRIKVEDEDRDALEPTEVEVNGLVYERYGTEEDYVEVRRDYIIARSMNTVEFSVERPDADDEGPEFLHDIRPHRPTARFPPTRDGGDEDERISQ